MSLLTKTYRTLNVSRSDRPARSTDPVTSTTFTIKGSFQPIGGNETFRDGKGGEQATHRLYSNINTNLIYGDKVTEGTQGYKVLYAIQPNGISGRGHHKEFICGVFE